MAMQKSLSFLHLHNVNFPFLSDQAHEDYLYEHAVKESERYFIYSKSK